MLRDYILVSRFGYTKAQIDEAPAVWLDWMIAIDGERQQAENDAQERSAR